MTQERQKVFTTFLGDGEIIRNGGWGVIGEPRQQKNMKCSKMPSSCTFILIFILMHVSVVLHEQLVNCTGHTQAVI